MFTAAPTLSHCLSDCGQPSLQPNVPLYLLSQTKPCLKVPDTAEITPNRGRFLYQDKSTDAMEDLASPSGHQALDESKPKHLPGTRELCMALHIHGE